MADPFLCCPKDWVRISLEAAPKTGYIEKVASGGTPSTTNEDYWDGEIPWLTPKEITNNQASLFVSKTERNITREATANSGAKLFPPNTVMLTKRAPVGAVAINTVPMATNQGFLNFVCGPKLRPQFLAYWFVANRPYLDAIANGSTYPELYTTDLFEFEVAVPSLDVQDKILAVLKGVKLLSLIGLPLEQSVVDSQEVLLIQEQNARLKKIHDELLPLLLSGELTA
jgi:restriction endonuclease S subunit